MLYVWKQWPWYGGFISWIKVNFNHKIFSCRNPKFHSADGDLYSQCPHMCEPGQMRSVLLRTKMMLVVALSVWFSNKSNIVYINVPQKKSVNDFMIYNKNINMDHVLIFIHQRTFTSQIFTYKTYSVIKRQDQNATHLFQYCRLQRFLKAAKLQILERDSPIVHSANIFINLF